MFITLNDIFAPAYSAAIDRAYASNAALAGEILAWKGKPRLAATVDIKTTLAPSASFNFPIRCRFFIYIVFVISVDVLLSIIQPSFLCVCINCLFLPIENTNYINRLDLDPSNLLTSNTLGVSPAGRTLTITYKYMGGSDHNVSAGEVNNFLANPGDRIILFPYDTNEEVKKSKKLEII